MINFKITLDKQIYNCHLSKIHRKNINLRVKVNNNIYLSKPKNVSVRKLKRFIVSNQDWIINKSRQINRLKAKRDNHLNHNFVFIFNEKFLFKQHKGEKIQIYDNKILYNQKNDSNDLKAYLNELLINYINLNREHLDEYLNKHKFDSPDILIKDLKSKWGVCFVNKNVIHINSKLIHYPKICLEYVLLHEYAHLIEPNHSKNFYKIIETFMPDYKEVVRYLKTN